VLLTLLFFLLLILLLLVIVPPPLRFEAILTTLAVNSAAQLVLRGTSRYKTLLAKLVVIGVQQLVL
jgi:hypothetical protein